jgi:invasion protein IalB
VKLTVLATSLFLALPVLAETPDAKTSKEFFQDWQLNCVEKGELKQCSVSQALRTQEGKTAAVINASYVKGEITLEFGMPLMMDLTTPVAVKVDGDDLAKYAYNACNNQACFVIRKDDEKLLAAFRKGTAAQMTLKSFPGQNIQMNVSLKGFGAAINELKKRSK